MPVEVKRTLTILKVDGGTIVVGPTDKIEQRQVIIEQGGGTVVLAGTEKIESAETEVTIVCDGPRCASRHETEGPMAIKFIEENVGKDPNALPDEFARLLKLTIDPINPREVALCSPRCLKDYLDYTYVPAQSPREIAAQFAANQAVDARNVEPIAGQAVYQRTHPDEPIPPHCGEVAEDHTCPGVAGGPAVCDCHSEVADDNVIAFRDGTPVARLVEPIQSQSNCSMAPILFGAAKGGTYEQPVTTTQ